MVVAVSEVYAAGGCSVTPRAPAPSAAAGLAQHDRRTARSQAAADARPLTGGADLGQSIHVHEYFTKRVSQCKGVSVLQSRAFFLRHRRMVLKIFLSR